MDIVLACDNNFAPYCATTIASVADHNIGTCFYLLTDNLSNENAVKLKSMTENMGSSLQIICRFWIVWRFSYAVISRLISYKSSHLFPTFYTVTSSFIRGKVNLLRL